MGVRTQALTVMTTVDPLSLHSGIEVLSGNTVQTYDKETEEWQPDRTLAPLVLQAYVEAADPEGVQGGRQELTGVEWYEGAPQADYSNRIADGTDYKVGDGTEAGLPKYALKVAKNVAAGAALMIYCVAKLTDTRTQTVVNVTLSVMLRTTVYEGNAYAVRLDCPPVWVIDPLKETTWQHTLTARLVNGTTAVAAAAAAYWWQWREPGGEWQEVTADDEKVWLSCRGADGEHGASLTFDARLVKAAAFRVRAQRYEGARPTQPQDSTVRAETSVRVAFPRGFAVNQTGTRGGRVGYDLGTEVGYRVDAFTREGAIGQEKARELLRVGWAAKSGKPGSVEVALGSGQEVSFVPKAKGFDRAYPVAVWAEVAMYERHVALTDDDGAMLTDGDGNALIGPVYH